MANATQWRGNVRESAGYRVLMGEIRMGDFGDPWGVAMGWLFDLAEVTWVEFGELLPEFRPAPSLRSRDDIDSYPAEMVLDMLDADEVTAEDIRRVFQVMSRYRDWVRLAGRDY